MNDSSLVYWTDFRCSDNENLQQKFVRLLKVGGLETLSLKGKFVAIKMHFGEPGCLGYLRPNWVKTLVDVLKANGAKPFLTDSNTLYVGRRKNALEHLEAAWENGFTPLSVGCPILIADGLKGTDDVAVPLSEEAPVREALIGRAVVDADVLISLTHFKCHEMTGIGGTLKNIGMGCASRAGKKVLHSSIHPTLHSERCVGCGACTRVCAHGACTLQQGQAVIDATHCVGCGRCIGVCNQDAIESDFGTPCAEMHAKIAAYTAACVKDKEAFHISFMCTISPHCDCHAMNDVPLIPDVGMAVSRNPVALDHACADLCNQAPLMPNCCLAGRDTHGDLFTTMHPATHWQDAITTAEHLHLGSSHYTLRKI